MKTQSIVLSSIFLLSVSASALEQAPDQLEFNGIAFPDVVNCDKQHDAVIHTREHGSRKEYTDAKRQYLACENVKHSINIGTGYDLNDYMNLHASNDAAEKGDK